VITKLVQRFRIAKCGVAQLYSPLIHPYLELTHPGHAWGWLACRAVRGVCPTRLWWCLNWSDAIMLRGKGWRGCSEPYAYNSKDGGCVNDCD